MRQQSWMIVQAALLLSVTISFLLHPCRAFTAPAILVRQHRTTSSRHRPQCPPLVFDDINKKVVSVPAPASSSSPLWQRRPTSLSSSFSSEEEEQPARPRTNTFRWWRRALRRLDTIQSAAVRAPGSHLDDPNTVVLTAGLFGPVKKLKKLHDPITYFVLGIIAGFRWDWCFKSPLYWFAIGFCIKWYRARYVFKLPVWDRQPNWNNVITSKEQEKDLKALTCKNCGSTLFVAKTREFFFEGATGIGGLGCFTCGAKGKDNFVEDRDRIVEDVGDMDDYFEYERPLDFVSRAERRKLLKEAKGDEEKANQLLVERQDGGSASEASSSDVSDAVVEEPSVPETAAAEEEPKDAVVEDAAAEETDSSSPADAKNVDDAATKEPEPVKEETEAVEAASTKPSVPDDAPEPKTTHIEKEAKPVAKKTEKPAKKKKAAPPKKVVSGSVDLDGLDELDMDAF